MESSETPVLHRGRAVYKGQCVYRACIILLYNDQQIRNFFTNYHSPATCFDNIVSSSGRMTQ